MIGQLCLDAHLSKRRNLYRQCAAYKPEGIEDCTTFSFIFIYDYFNGFFKSFSEA